MPEPAPGSPSSPEDPKPTDGSGSPPAPRLDRRVLIGGGVAVGLVAAVALGVYATPPAAYEGIGDCEELFAEGFADAVAHTSLEDVEIEEVEPMRMRPPLAEDGTGPEYSACGGSVGEADLIVDFTLYSPDTAASNYEPLQEGLAAIRESAEEGPKDGSEQLAVKDIEVGEEGLATLDKIGEEASIADPTGDESLLHTAFFRMSNVSVTVRYLTEDTTLPDEDLILVTRISEALEESIDATAE
ncbi:hypothetical protein [Nocardiopsis halophila]|uniref:hypothetical protein n=1 Tax=Nocardiopsis halophila TaxID=141692 RepID=UPI000347C323|nr:hypothetical protein [Nocardiopsis halophila]